MGSNALSSLKKKKKKNNNKKKVELAISNFDNLFSNKIRTAYLLYLSVLDNVGFHLFPHFCLIYFTFSMSNMCLIQQINKSCLKKTKLVFPVTVITSELLCFNMMTY